MDPSNETALLMRDIGVAVDMDYKLIGFILLCRIQSLTCISIITSDTPTAITGQELHHLDDWTNLLINELNLGRPILYRERMEIPAMPLSVTVITHPAIFISTGAGMEITTAGLRSAT